MWPLNKSVDQPMDELLTFNYESTTMKQVPFVTMFSEKGDTNWEHAKSNVHWCRGVFASQATVEYGLTEFFNTVEQKAKETKSKHLVGKVLP